jgi:hypothetical protein
MPVGTVDLIVELRKQLAEVGLDAGPDTIAWHLQHHHQLRVSAATISRCLSRAGLVTPAPKKRPKASSLRFAATLPNQCWQSDFTHYRLTRADGGPGADVEVLSWLDDHARFALSVTAHVRVTTPIVLGTFREAAGQHGTPASTLTDNGMVYTTRFAGGRGGRTSLEAELLHARLSGIAAALWSARRLTTASPVAKTERIGQTHRPWRRRQWWSRGRLQRRGPSRSQPPPDHVVAFSKHGPEDCGAGHEERKPGEPCHEVESDSERAELFVVLGYRSWHPQRRGQGVRPAADARDERGR